MGLKSRKGGLIVKCCCDVDVVVCYVLVVFVVVVFTFSFGRGLFLWLQGSSSENYLLSPQLCIALLIKNQDTNSLALGIDALSKILYFYVESSTSLLRGKDSKWPTIKIVWV